MNTKAFPVDPMFSPQWHGMDLADYFAAKAMQSILAGNWSLSEPDAVARKAYEYADAMMQVHFNRD